MIVNPEVAATFEKYANGNESIRLIGEDEQISKCISNLIFTWYREMDGRDFSRSGKAAAMVYDTVMEVASLTKLSRHYPDLLVLPDEFGRPITYRRKYD